jgi:hypothetical protein
MRRRCGHLFCLLGGGKLADWMVGEFGMNRDYRDCEVNRSCGG